MVMRESGLSRVVPFTEIDYVSIERPFSRLTASLTGRLGLDLALIFLIFN